MIATHNIKVNDRWYKAGEEYEVKEPKTPEKAVEDVIEIMPEATAQMVVAEEPKPDPKPKAATSRRKASNK